MNNLETISVGATSLMLSWAMVGRPVYNFLKSNQEKEINEENKYDEEFSRAVEEYK